MGRHCCSSVEDIIAPFAVDSYGSCRADGLSFTMITVEPGRSSRRWLRCGVEEKADSKQDRPPGSPLLTQQITNSFVDLRNHEDRACGHIWWIPPKEEIEDIGFEALGTKYIM